MTIPCRPLIVKANLSKGHSRRGVDVQWSLGVDDCLMQVGNGTKEEHSVPLLTYIYSFIPSIEPFLTVSVSGRDRETLLYFNFLSNNRD